LVVIRPGTDSDIPGCISIAQSLPEYFTPAFRLASDGRSVCIHDFYVILCSGRSRRDSLGLVTTWFPLPCTCRPGTIVQRRFSYASMDYPRVPAP